MLDCDYKKLGGKDAIKVSLHLKETLQGGHIEVRPNKEPPLQVVDGSLKGVENIWKLGVPGSTLRLKPATQTFYQVHTSTGRCR